MAETMLANFTNFESEAPAAPSDEGRPPKLTQIEAAYLLERGPYIARLRAKERLLEVVLALTVDEEVRTVMDLRQPDEIKEDIVRLESELVEFETKYDWQATTSSDASTDQSTEKLDAQAVADNRIVIPVDFLKKREAAVCSETDPEVFFPEKGGSTRQAKKVCTESCDLTDECLAYALDKKERFGIWGGKSERERRKLLKGRVSS